MKKVIGFLSVGILFTVSFFLTENIENINSGIGLSELMKINTANAEVTKTNPDGTVEVECEDSTVSCAYKVGSNTVTVDKHVKPEDPA